MRNISFVCCMFMIFLLLSCTSAKFTPTQTITPTTTPKPTLPVLPSPTLTLIPTLTTTSAILPTLTATPTQTILQRLDPFAVTADNAAQITLLASWEPYDVWSIAISPDSKLIALGLHSGLIKLMDLSSGLEISTMGSHEITIRSLAFSPGGDLLVSMAADGYTSVWDVNTGEESFNFTSEVEKGYGVGGKPSVDISPDGKLLAFSGPNGQVHLWDMIQHVELKPLGEQVDTHLGGAVSAVTFSPDGKTLAAGYAKPNFAAQDSIFHLIVLWDPISGQELRTLESSGYATIPNISSLAFSPDGKQLAAGYFEAKTTLWELASGQAVYSIADPGKGEMSALVFSPPGNVLAMCSDLGPCRLINTANGMELITLTDSFYSLDFSPDGRVLVTGTVNQTVQVWGLPTKTP